MTEPRRAPALHLAAAGAALFWATAAPAAWVDFTPAPQWPPERVAAARAAVPPGARRVILGESHLLVPRGARVGVQVDRVIRDIHWTPSDLDAAVPADRVPAGPDQVVPYMEGARVRDLMAHAGVAVVPLTPAHVEPRHDPSAPMPYGLAGDGEGAHRFVVDGTKLAYTTARRLADGTVELPDTHGFAAVAEAALRERPLLAVACMDMESKAEAALWLARHGIAGYATTDRFGYLLLGYRLLEPQAAPIVPGAPIRPTGDGALIGAQPLAIALDEPIVAQATERQSYPWQYADTPWRYFAALSDLYGLDLRLHKHLAEGGELSGLLAKARAVGARVVGVRVGKTSGEGEAERDAEALAAWLGEDPRHRAVLFHTAAYEPGYALFERFPAQTTFGDPMPRFE